MPEYFNKRASDINEENKRLSANGENSLFENAGLLEIAPAIFQQLFDHQIVGINFLYENFKSKNGCILADDMGLGKTVQVSTFLTSLKIKGLISKGLVVVPATLIDYWESELKRWTPKEESVRIIKIYGTIKQRQNAVMDSINKNIIAIVSPETFKSDYEFMSKKITWDVMVLDEGHKAKNVATKLRKALKDFKVRFQKIILTGTPV